MREQEAVFIVEVEEGLRIAIPGWMLEESVCRGLVLEERPRVGVEALMRLRDLIDRQAGESGNGGGSMKATTQPHDEPANNLQGGRAPRTATDT